MSYTHNFIWINNIKPHKIYLRDSHGFPILFYTVGSRIPLLCLRKTEQEVYSLHTYQCTRISHENLLKWEMNKTDLICKDFYIKAYSDYSVKYIMGNID